MKAIDKSLVSKLVIAVLIKLLVLLALWWVFFHDQRVAVDANQVSDQLFAPKNAADQNGEKP